MNVLLKVFLLSSLLLFGGCFGNYEEEYESCMINYTNIEKKYNSCKENHEDFVSSSESEIDLLETQIYNFKNNESYLIKNVNETILEKAFFEDNTSGINIEVTNFTFIIFNFFLYLTLGLKFEVINKFIFNIRISRENAFGGLIIFLLILYFILEYILMVINFFKSYL